MSQTTTKTRLTRYDVTPELLAAWSKDKRPGVREAGAILAQMLGRHQHNRFELVTDEQDIDAANHHLPASMQLAYPAADGRS